MLNKKFKSKKSLSILFELLILVFSTLAVWDGIH